jgi:hypothetical protein
MRSKWLSRLAALIVLIAAAVGSFTVALVEPPGGTARLGR